jgi:hypothetical protein
VKRRDDPHQTLINWGNPQAAVSAPESSIPHPIKLAASASPALVQRLRWDFTSTFPPPTEEALDAGVISEEDCTPERIRILHEQHAREALGVLRDLDIVMDARRQGIDSKIGKPPRTHASRENLKRYHQDEPKRLEHYFHILMETYENAFGVEAADAFTKCIRARHAGIPVEMEDRNAGQLTADQLQFEAAVMKPAITAKRRSPTVLPVPKPLPEAIKAGHFGEQAGGPVNPKPAEVRAITEQHAEKIVDLLDGLRHMERARTAPQCSDRARVGAEVDRLEKQIRAEIDKYAASFGQSAAAQLEQYVRRQQRQRQADL